MLHHKKLFILLYYNIIRLKKIADKINHMKCKMKTKEKTCLFAMKNDKMNNQLHKKSGPSPAVLLIIEFQTLTASYFSRPQDLLGLHFLLNHISFIKCSKLQ